MMQFLKKLIWDLDLWLEIVTAGPNFQQAIIFTFDKTWLLLLTYFPFL